MIKLPSWLSAQSTLTKAEVQHGLNMVMRDGIFTQVLSTLTGGAFLVAFALGLGASNFEIGLIASVSAFAQILQIPSIYLVEATRQRKALIVISLFLSRILWFPLALLPWLVPQSWQITLLIVALFLFSATGTVAGLAWNSWMRDLVPEEVLGRYMGKRMAIATFAGAVLSLAAGFGVDLYKQYYSDNGIYSIYFVLGGIAGLVSVWFLGRAPEPQMDRPPHQSIWKPIIEPFQDVNFRRLLVFLGSWNFAINLAAPFFTVYMLKRLDMSMSAIIAFSVLSQIFNVIFYRFWGRLADRYSNKSVMTQAGAVFVYTLIFWPFTDLSDDPVIVISLLVLIHALAGVSTAGINLCTGNIALRLAPKGRATGYLAVRSLVSGVAATIAPLIGGLLATWFEGEHITLTLRWISDSLRGDWSVIAASLRGLDFLFILSFFFGLYSLHRLLAVREQGEVEKGVLLAEFNGELRRAARDISNMAGMRDMLYFPFSHLARLVGERRKHRRQRIVPQEEEPLAPIDK